LAVIDFADYFMLIASWNYYNLYFASRSILISPEREWNANYYFVEE